MAGICAVTASGFIYNLGLLAGPWFEGQMTGCRVNLLRGSSQFKDILPLVFLYVGAITYRVSDRELRKDILLLLTSIKDTTSNWKHNNKEYENHQEVYHELF